MTHLSLPAILFELRSGHCANLARCISEFLNSGPNLLVRSCHLPTSMNLIWYVYVYDINIHIACRIIVGSDIVYSKPHIRFIRDNFPCFNSEKHNFLYYEGHRI